MMNEKGESDASDKHQGQGGQCEVGTVGEGTFPFLFSQKQEHQGREAAEDTACRRHEDEGVGAQPEAQAGHQFDVTATQGAAGQNAQKKERRPAPCRRQGVVREEGGINSGESHAAQGQGNHHAVEEAVLFKVRSRHEQQQRRHKEQKEKGQS